MMIITLPPPFPHRIRSNEDEGDAEQLAHVERHSLFKGHLLLFQKFHEEAEEEDGEDAVAEVEAGADQFCKFLRFCVFVFLRCLQLCMVLCALCFIPTVDAQATKEDDEVGNGLVELGGMAWREYAVNHRFTCVEDESPGHIGHIANDFGVHQVT